MDPILFADPRLLNGLEGCISCPHFHFLDELYLRTKTTHLKIKSALQLSYIFVMKQGFAVSQFGHFENKCVIQTHCT